MALDRKPLDATAFGLMIVLCMLWGFQQVTIKVAAPDVSLVMQAGIRSIIATALLLVWARARRIPVNLASLLTEQALPALAVLAILLVAYLVMGMFLEGFAMMVLTVPIVFPIIQALGIDPVWFGIFMVIVLEMGLISPPVGINVFVVKGVAEDVPMGRIFAGITPFWIAMLVCVLVITAFPQIVMILPNTMMQ